MKVSIKQLLKFYPELPSQTDQLCEWLTNLGIEAVPDSRDVLDVTITPNRGDAMSALGLARDLSAWLHRNDVTAPAPITVADTKLIDRAKIAKAPQLIIEAPKLVPAYEAVVFESVSIQPSPAWLKRAVTALGWRPINNVVDLTNYLMDVYGQPLHAFDLDAILGGTLTIRLSKAGESLTTLDGVVRELPEGLLVIADRDGLIDLAGVMGGANSQIHPRTTRVLLQAVTFDPTSIRRATNATRHRTQAAIRYERGTDPAIARPVLNEAIRQFKGADFGRATALGQISQSLLKRKASAIVVPAGAVAKLLGMKIPVERQVRWLELLGCSVTKTATGLSVRPPSWRHDLKIWQDVADEIARLSGLNDELRPSRLPKQSSGKAQSRIEWAESLKDRLIELGLSEVLTYSFTSKALLATFELPVVGELANPLNPTLRYLRPSLVPNVAQVIAANQGFDPMLLFEIGHTFTRTTEEERLVIALAGQTAATDSWLARLADAIGIDSSILRSSAVIFELTEAQRATLKIRKPRVTMIEFRLDDLAAARRIPAAYALPTSETRYRPVSRFPSVARDVALLVPATVVPSALETFVLAFDQWVEAATLFDEYQSPKLGVGLKSLAYHIRYADPDRTLTEHEVTALHERLIAAVERTFDATVR